MSSAQARPLYFGPPDRTLFGWLHPACGPEAKNTGIVLCNPTGYEALCTHRSYRHFAEAAAARGFPSLRFDYDGTGDSAGHPLDPDRLDHWLRSIAMAIDTIKARTGVERVCLFGVRVGAGLAAKAAQGRTDVHAMIAFAPVVKIKSYLREIRALSLARPASPPPADFDVDPELQEAGGFATTPDTRAALASIDLLTLDAAPAARVLVLERDDFPSNDAWPQRLTSLGATVEQRQLAGYADMMRDAHASKVPTQLIVAALDWLSESGVVARPPAVDGLSTKLAIAEFSERGRKVRETAVNPDDDGTLFGILSEPAECGRDIRDVVVLLNAGTNHHIGPARLYVAIARLCATGGVGVLRLDLSGVGDSRVRPGAAENEPYSEGAIADVRQAVEFVRHRFPNARVHLFGLCSGAYHGLKAAVAGIALCSVIVVNPLTFFWKAGMSLDYADFQVTAESSRYSRSVKNLASWLKLIRGQVDVGAAAVVIWKRLGARARDSLRDLARQLGIALADDLASELLRVSRQRTDLYFVFSASDPGYAMLCDQGGRIVGKLARDDRLRISFVQGADHTFTSHWNRDQLIALLMAHLERHAAAR